MSDQFVQDVTTGLAMEGHVSQPFLLGQAREAAGLHIAALAAALKVPVKKLEALEAGRYDELPDLVFARALASSACRHLKVDSVPILQQIPAGVIPALGDSGMAINTPFKPVSGGTSANTVGWLSRPAVVAAVVFMVGAMLLAFLPDMPPLAESVANASVANALSGESSVPVHSTSGEGPAISATARVSLDVPAASTDVAVAPSPVLDSVSLSVTKQPEVVSEAVVSPQVLAIRATGESWVQVTDANSTVVIQRMLKAGDAVDFSAAPPYAVVVGRVDNAEVQVRGRAFDASPFARNGVARFEVK